jgi:hypothetical protein
MSKYKPVVYPIKEDEEEPFKEKPTDKQAEFLKIFPPPSLITIYASFRSGKSVLCNNMVLNDTMLRGLLDKWVIFSPTALQDNACKYLLEDDGVDVIDEYSDDYLRALLDYQMETPKSERDTLGVIFDDSIQYLNKRSSVGNFLATRFRHYNIKYLIYVSQSFRALDTKVRSNSKQVIIMKISNEKELSKLTDELSGYCGGAKNFLKLYNYCLDDQPFSFMTINIDHNPPLVYLRLERQIYPPLNDKIKEEEEEKLE